MTTVTALTAVALLGLGVSMSGPGQDLELTFRASDPALEGATAAYRALWSEEGDRIVDALERVSGLRFGVDAIDVTVIEAPSWAGRDSMGMRASYPPDTKRATLTHELGHILIGDLIPEDDDGEPVADHHRVLFLFLYDVWIDLWGRDFADEQVAVESRRRGRVDYEGIWRETLRRDAAERAAELSALIERWTGRQNERHETLQPRVAQLPRRATASSSDRRCTSLGVTPAASTSASVSAPQPSPRAK